MEPSLALGHYPFFFKFLSFAFFSFDFAEVFGGIIIFLKSRCQPAGYIGFPQSVLQPAGILSDGGTNVGEFTQRLHKELSVRSNLVMSNINGRGR